VSISIDDVRSWQPDQPHPHLLAFLQKTLPRLLPDTAVQWRERRDLLELFAVNYELGVGKIGDRVREDRYRQFSRIVFQRQPPEPEPEGTEESPDEYDEQFGGLA
jgi:hypothetical protein